MTTKQAPRYMKGISILLLLFFSNAISAQLTIGPGAQFIIRGNAQLTLHNSSLVNNGTFAAGTGSTRFTGHISSSISGTGALQFYELEISKTGNSSVMLGRSISAVRRILFSAGFLDLNSFNIDLGATAFLEGERENSRISGITGGKVSASAALHAPAGANPGRLGIFITSSQNLGNVTIRRGHQPQAPGFGISRYYDIVPENNADLNATARFYYLNAELNGIDENSLAFYKSDNTINWSYQGFTSRDSIANYAEKTGINAFARLTLANGNSALPVQIVLFNVHCVGTTARITWKTAQEQHSSHFNIERSSNGAAWTVIGNVPAAGNASNERNYSFTDNDPGQNRLYRLAQYDLDGRVHYTTILRSACSQTDGFAVWPNPVRDRIFINIISTSQSQAIIKLFDSKGATIKERRATVLQGSNQITVDTGSLPGGTYMLTADWNNGQMRKTAWVLKQ